MIAIGVWQGWLGLYAIFAAMAVLGSVQAFERPTMAALLPAIVPAGTLPRAIANSTSVMQTALVVGPSLAGLLYGVGPVVPFAVATLFFLCASISVTAHPASGRRAEARAGDAQIGVRRRRLHPLASR